MYKEQFPDVQELYEKRMDREMYNKKIDINSKDIPYVYTGTKSKFEKMRKEIIPSESIMSK